ncbi:sodium:proton exchanger [Candidatus Kaiserbacteria bacterium CG10_big_fil_rev_8_21_14_0_10_59_10]|uniref:Sodium:proton exchanger n=1 Tax=Candidatus Kaiserbacteria bacterium CG10_big_fil_rev_8_21_14_0_10_59_10 TaxID=1974612 RepID=A0A2H0U8C3_9BACT|nr:MAG: sodium:proton exchanger [Candidatus Kaiserbacteria bacterium CG10_big_fil_rev_8_21_14_0_10_59_10]
MTHAPALPHAPARSARLLLLTAGRAACTIGMLLFLRMDLFAEISLLIAIAVAVAAVMRVLRQPLIIGHIITGLIVGPAVFNLIDSEETLALLSEIGIAILLFTVGLHLSPDIIRKFGRVSLITGVGQVAFTSFFGYFICIMLGIPPAAAVYVAIALAFSSTIIIMKLIADKGDLETLYAKISVGFLLVQDLIVVLLLLAIPMFSAAGSSLSSFGKFMVTGTLLILFVVLASRFFVSKASRFLSQSQEFLFLFAAAWGMGVAALFSMFGFSLESGALIAGVALASLPARHEVSARLTPLRDFFIVMFFILLGAQMHFGDVAALLPAALLLSAFVLFGNPIILMTLMGLMGYRKKTSLQTGFTVAQISEFSLILVALGVTFGHVAPEYLSLVTLVGLLTICGSTYLVLYSDRIYRFLSPYLGLFERSDAHESHPHAKRHPVVLFGCNRIGHDFLATFEESGENFLVVDYDPDIIAELEKRGIATEFGDASDLDFLSSLDFSQAQLVISTIPDPETNILITRAVKAAREDAVVMVLAHRVQDALEHYKQGADYVIMPHFLGGRYAAELVIKLRNDKHKYGTLRERHIKDLLSRLALGHEHPFPASVRL